MGSVSRSLACNSQAWSSFGWYRVFCPALCSHHIGPLGRLREVSAFCFSWRSLFFRFTIYRGSPATQSQGSSSTARCCGSDTRKRFWSLLGYSGVPHEEANKRDHSHFERRPEHSEGIAIGRVVG